MYHFKPIWFVLFVVFIAGIACNDETRETQKMTRGPTKSLITAENMEVPTFNSSYIEIDKEDSESVGDANLFLDTDPNAEHIPPCLSGDCTFIDWNDLCTSEKDMFYPLLDDVKSDSTAFPRSNHCVASANVLGKMDITYVMAANNAEYAYFAVQRRNNNGDAAYYWLFTREEVPEPLEPECKEGELELIYTISPGDVLLRGDFSPSRGPGITVYTALSSKSETDTDTPASVTVTAVGAINYENADLWTKVDDSEIFAAINTSPMNPGACGAVGVDKQMIEPDGSIEEELFAEAVIPISVFARENICDLTFWGSVITRPSGSGGTTPDLKDLFGPKQFNFGRIMANSKLTPSCEENFGYGPVEVKGFDGEPLDAGIPRTCYWTFNNGAYTDTDTVDPCGGGIIDVAPITADYLDINAGLTVDVEIFPGEICSVTANVDPIRVFPKLGVVADGAANCDLQFNFDSFVTGGMGLGVDYYWTITPNTNVSVSYEGDGSGGNAEVAAPGDYHAKVLVSEVRYRDTDESDTDPGIGELICTDTDAVIVSPLAPLSVTLSMYSPPDPCSENNDDVTYHADLSGGSGNPTLQTLSWLLSDTGISCADNTDCTIDPGDTDYCFHTTIQAMVKDDFDVNGDNDASNDCDAVYSDTDEYTKQTAVTTGGNIPILE